MGQNEPRICICDSTGRGAEGVSWYTIRDRQLKGGEVRALLQASITHSTHELVPGFVLSYTQISIYKQICTSRKKPRKTAHTCVYTCKGTDVYTSKTTPAGTYQYHSQTTNTNSLKYTQWNKHTGIMLWHMKTLVQASKHIAIKIHGNNPLQHACVACLHCSLCCYHCAGLAMWAEPPSVTQHILITGFFSWYNNTTSQTYIKTEPTKAHFCQHICA